MSGQSSVRKMSCQVDVMPGKCFQEFELEPICPDKTQHFCLQITSFGHYFIVRLALHLSQNTSKQTRNAKNKKCIAGFLRHFFHISWPFCFLHFAPGSALARKLNRILWFIFCDINKTQNSHELRKLYSECFVFRVVFRENIRKIPAKCEIRKVYCRPYTLFTKSTRI